MLDWKLKKEVAHKNKAIDVLKYKAIECAMKRNVVVWNRTSIHDKSVTEKDADES